LRSGDAGRAWKQFISDYGALLLKVVRSYAQDVDRQSECFVYVCEKLCDDGFKRLLKFKVDGRARFSTWLGVVSANLCIDWLRDERGRKRPFANIGRLPRVEQRLFHHRFERRLPKHDCYSALRFEFPDLTAPRFDEAVARLEQTLSPQQRWRLSIDGQRDISIDDAEADQMHDGASVEDGAASAEEHVQLAVAMDRLNERERLMLTLRYEQDLTFDQIGRLLNLGDAFRARRQIQAALDRLAELFAAK